MKEKFSVHMIKVGRRGQITLPSGIRRKYNLEEGDQLAVFTHGDQLILRPLTGSLLDLRGSVPVQAPQDFDAIRRQVIESRSRQTAQNED
jgi:AbrB family looped-hinge helix DNA binding protein